MMDDSAKRWIKAIGSKFTNVEVLAHNEHVMLCRVAGHVVTIPQPCVLPGTTIPQRGDLGTLVLTREVARTLGLL
jgi:hypothetical protein